jgi:tetratricopeptide (TPR) repeat protein
VAVRAAIQADDWGRVRALVGALDGSKAPAWFAASVGFHRMVPFEDGVRLMAAAWRTHPAEYLLAYRIALLLWGKGDDRLGEMLTWSRVAVALRPESPFAHTQLATAWRGMHNWAEAEASSRRAIELGRNYPRFAGAHISLGNVLLEKGDLDGAESSYRNAMVVDPGATGTYFNMGLLNDRRGDLAAAEEWYRKAVAANPARVYFRKALDDVVRKRAQLARLDEVAAGRANPANSAEGIELAEHVSRPPRRRYVLAVRIYTWAFAARPALANDLRLWHRYKAASLAVLAAAGKDEEMTKFGVEEWAYLTGQARGWLRANLARLAIQAKGPQRRREVGETLKRWKQDGDLAPVRDPAWLAAMPPDDRQAWEALWREVDAVLASTTEGAGPPPARP